MGSVELASRRLKPIGGKAGTLPGKGRPPLGPDQYAIPEGGTRDTSGAPPIFLERAEGIEPSSSAWKAAALPLSYAREGEFDVHRNAAGSLGKRQARPAAGLVAEEGFEPPTSRL